MGARVDAVRMAYEPDLPGFVVTMPDLITLEAVDEWGARFHDALARVVEGDPCDLLLDTNTHEFESIACLRELRGILEGAVVAAKVRRAAMVAPASVRAPGVVSDREAYFSGVAEARAWLAGRRS